MNQLIVIENGQLDAICLDDKPHWEVGRGSPDCRPDIRLHSLTVSRKQGRFQNMDGCWCYVDYSGKKNGTYHNQKRLSKGLGGRVKPVMLSDGDTLIFGSGDSPVLNGKTTLALFYTKSMEGQWRASDTRNVQQLEFFDGVQLIRLEKPVRGTVVEQENGIAIYMGDITYLLGKTQLRMV